MNIKPNDLLKCNFLYNSPHGSKRGVTKNMEISNDLTGQQFICTLEGEAHSWKGYVAIDSVIDGKATGGVMMMPDVSLNELKHIAHTMTLKYGFLGIPRGGAKAAIITAPEGDPVIKREILSEFGEKMAPLILKGVYEPGADMGVGSQDLHYILSAAGLKMNRRRDPVSHASSGYFTSMTVFAAAQVAVEKLGMVFNKCTAAVQGFGNVGGALAQLYTRYGVKVVSVSTIEGSVYNTSGLDITNLRNLYRQHGSSMVNHVDGEKIENNDLLSMNVDIISPCARMWSITEKNADKIRAKIIAPGANCAVSLGADRILFSRGILSIPHFTANCGGALGSTMQFLGCTETQIAQFVELEIKRKISNLLNKSEREGVLPIVLAKEEALRKFNRMQSIQTQSSMKQIIRIGMYAYRVGLFPPGIMRRFIPQYLKNKFWADSILN
jgi:glutamate dehydrogenase/leucine dehydrogenase